MNHRIIMPRSCLAAPAASLGLHELEDIFVPLHPNPRPLLGRPGFTLGVFHQPVRRADDCYGLGRDARRQLSVGPGEEDEVLSGREECIVAPVLFSRPAALAPAPETHIWHLVDPGRLREGVPACRDSVKSPLYPCLDRDILSAKAAASGIASRIRRCIWRARRVLESLERVRARYGAIPAYRRHLGWRQKWARMQGKMRGRKEGRNVGGWWNTRLHASLRLLG